ncbi:MAG: HAD family hydrolase [Planctomycetota bacterium]
MFVFFDIDGTLFDDRKAQRAGVAEFYRAHRAELEGAEETFWDTWRAVAEDRFDRYLAGEFTFKGQRRERLRYLFGREIPDPEADELYDEYYGYYRSNWSLYPEAEACFESFPQRGIISNGDAKSQREKIAAVGLEGRFDPVLVSGDIGIHKPDARVFDEACRLAGVAPAECVYVGDRLEGDAVGARNAGMTGVWVDRDDEGGTPQGVHRIADLSELPALVKTLR